MALTLAVLRCPDSAVPETRRVEGGEFTIGRGADCHWVLADPDRVISKRHCVLEFRGGFWELRDTSANGTYLNHAAEPIGRDRVAPLSDGDRLRIGSYEIEARIEAAAERAPAWSAPIPGLDPAPARPGTPASRLPADFDPFAEHGPMPDHRPATSDYFPPPRPAAAPPAASGSLLPDDWDLDLPKPGVAPPPPVAAPPSGSPAGADPFAVAPPPVAPPARLPPRPAQGAPDPFALDPFAEPAPPPRPAPPPAAPPEAPAFAPPATPAVAPPAAPSFAPPAAPSFAPPAAPPAFASPPAAASPGTGLAPEAALAAFLAGAGIPPQALPPGDPAAQLAALGGALRAAVAGLRSLLIARADVKREFRIEQTMLRAAGNNPVKFAATDAQAIAALASGQGAQAIEETVADLTAHQVASLAATQAAAKALLARLSPLGLETLEPAAGGGLFGASREKRLWDAYKRLHQQVTDQFDDDFDSAFGKEFARAYEQASRRGGG
jgi:type VI secretion system protein ImpI/type VI secretion system protein